MNIECEKPITADAARKILREAPGILVIDKREPGGYITPHEAAGEDATYISRIREDATVENGLAFWCVSDNLRKGAALNAIQIAEALINRKLLRPNRKRRNHQTGAKSAGFSLEGDLEPQPDPVTELKLPEALRPFNNFVLDVMGWLNGLAHLVLGLALGASVLLFTWLFVADIWSALGTDNLAQGFLHGLGTLMLLWTVSALITAEIRYMRGHKPPVDTFVEVAIVVLVRKLITMPVQSTLPSPRISSSGSRRRCCSA